jgi:hypothetical protein
MYVEAYYNRVRMHSALDYAARGSAFPGLRDKKRSSHLPDGRNIFRSSGFWVTAGTRGASRDIEKTSGL